MTVAPDEYREICFEHKPERCVVCGATENVVVHHADGDRSNNCLANLIPLCRHHHSKVHSGVKDDGLAPYVDMLPEEQTTPFESTASDPFERSPSAW